jgi:hypothetical protein
MKKFLGRRPSIPAIIVLAAVVVAVGGGAYALAAGNTIHACAKKSNGALRLASRCKHSERGVSWNITGPKGATGATGPKGATGAAGATGPQGPAGTTSVVAGFKDGPVVLPFSTTTYTTEATLNLPGGKWAVFAKATITNVAGTGATIAHCQLVSSSGDFDDTVLALDDHNVGTAYSGALELNVNVNLTAAGTAKLQCRNEGGGSTNIAFMKMSAIQAANLTNSAL